MIAGGGRNGSENLMSEWNPQDSLLAVTHRWPWILASLLVGGLLGALVALLWPSPFRASTEIFVGLNPYRALEDRYVAAFAQTEFRNVDDYKYWQMQQLNGLAFSDQYLQPTLSMLRQEDDFWQEIEIDELRDMLAVYWRNAGEWRLVAESSNPNHATQAVQAWKAVILEKAGSAISSSKELFRLELELRSITDLQLESRTRINVLEQVGEALQTLKNDLSHIDSSRPLGDLERWYLWSLAAQVAGNDTNWRTLLEGVPPQQSNIGDYLTWIDSLINAVEVESDSVSIRLKALEGERTKLFEQWKRTLQEGQGLAATLQVESPSDSDPEINKVRPTALAMLIGGALGFLVFSAMVLVEVSKKKPI